MPKWKLSIDDRGPGLTDDTELFPDGTDHGGEPTLDDVAKLLDGITMRTFLDDWQYGQDLVVTLVDDAGRVLEWDGWHARIREPVRGADTTRKD